jgi:DNA-directed RNA polymerase subunit RPC12/RpoP
MTKDEVREWIRLREEKARQERVLASKGVTAEPPVLEAGTTLETAKLLEPAPHLPPGCAERMIKLGAPINGVGVLRYPVGSQWVALVSAIAQKIQNGSILLLPNTKDEQGDYLWDFHVEGVPVCEKHSSPAPIKQFQLWCLSCKARFPDRIYATSVEEAEHMARGAKCQGCQQPLTVALAVKEEEQPKWWPWKCLHCGATGWVTKGTRGMRCPHCQKEIPEVK